MFLDTPECDPDKCPYARGHFDRVNDAVFVLMDRRKSAVQEEFLPRQRSGRSAPLSWGLTRRCGWME